MATVTGITSAKAADIENASVVSGVIDEDNHLILTTHGGTDIDAGLLPTAEVVPDATTSVKGIVELATSGETTTGTDAVRAVTPAGLKAATDILNGSISSLTTTVGGKQASSADLTAIAALTPSNDDILQRKAGSWVNRTMANLATDLSLSGKTDKSTLTTKGDLYAATAASTPARVAVGSNGQVLTADSSQTAGVHWATPSGGSGSASWWTRARSGIWYPLTGYGTTGGTSAAVITTNTEYCMPMTVGFSGNITGIAISKTTTTGNMRLGVRDDGSDMSPGSVLYDSGALGTASGIIAVTGISVAITKGVPFWISVVSQGGGGTVIIESIIHPFVGSVSSTTPVATDFTSGQPSSYTQASVSGALGTFTITGTGPTIVIKIQFGSITQGP